uniref:Uncharacterized protein n=1 Tax=Parascaris univalens TaxID=6257 RepID=A0A915BRN5_PARUN
MVIVGALRKLFELLNVQHRIFYITSIAVDQSRRIVAFICRFGYLSCWLYSPFSLSSPSLCHCCDSFVASDKVQSFPVPSTTSLQIPPPLTSKYSSGSASFPSCVFQILQRFISCLLLK